MSSESDQHDPAQSQWQSQPQPDRGATTRPAPTTPSSVLATVLGAVRATVLARVLATSLAMAATLTLAGCGSGSGRPAETVSASGAPQCSVSYHSTNSGTALAITTTVAGKLDISVAAVKGADEQTLTVAQPGLVHVNVSETGLDTLTATLTSTAGLSYHCSVTPG